MGSVLLRVELIERAFPSYIFCIVVLQPLDASIGLEGHLRKSTLADARQRELLVLREVALTTKKLVVAVAVLVMAGLRGDG